ncbi:immunity 8 family protein [Burkholderia sp. BKH01]|uniref:immunity 8 family protein n=1 Tax=Burkholderia sp. BKH01 TaxID=2769262 RepID=UPI0021DFA1E5|nr:immunity 8 family protein [Burkholderia sp. BKH01]MCU9954649.1 immunity 8 family protein [Burkholderia sp. BKH01]
MKAKVKSFDLGGTVGVFEYVPEDQDCFCLWMTFVIGSVVSDGGDYFRLMICTPGWLKNNLAYMSWGRHMLIVNDGYKPQSIIDYVGEFLASLDEKDWPALTAKISRVMEWEFEDYKN